MPEIVAVIDWPGVSVVGPDVVTTAGFAFDTLETRS
jgi:hypothetical protein